MILTLNQLQERLSQMSYRPGWEMNIYEGVFEGLQFELKAEMEDNFNPGKPFDFHCVSPLPPFLSIQQFDLWVAWRLKRIEIHECLESLKVNGKPIFDPHRPNSDQDRL